MTEKTTLIMTAFAMSIALAAPAMADGMQGQGMSGAMGAGMAGDMHDEAGDKHGEEFAFGEKGDPADVARTIEIDMMDNAFNHKSLDIMPGETIRFKVHNSGEFVHEFNIAMMPMHMEHQEQMMQMMESGVLEGDRINHAMMSGDMMHNDPNSVLLEPGQSGEVIWHFQKASDVEFACNVPGHYEAGMRGPIMFQGQ